MTHLENHPFAFIDANDTVTDILLFDSHEVSLLEQVKELKNSKEYVSCCEYGTGYVNGTWDGTKFWLPKPFPSWVKGINNWEAPIAYPTNGKNYTWDEETISWIEVAP